ncbi:hypothetical protein PECL_1553 [Pediococcus claussenii ATCC BAA-344]|uniref:Uncharacterized protein n=1 Tax=Pediococcus claussenii (strain ATCC BAA-344 / DSM 14800 / JCM 18046 / KCTC 3811 / LMG 21948 / P06) TaxID=701521 RepID=G8PAI3_PEDCP|nr:hypothetical protein PECL_1553 [Pediococcus claussenii ATCC BAA-344]
MDYLFLAERDRKNEATKTKITAPKIDGTSAMPARYGPQDPSMV